MSGLNKETLIRILSAIITLPVLAYALITDSFLFIPTLIVSIVVSLITLYEYYMISAKDENNKAFIKTGLIGGLILNIIMYFYAFEKFFASSRLFQNFDARAVMGFLVLLIAILLVQQLLTRPLKGGIYSLAVTLFGIMYIVLSMSHIILLKSLKDGSFYIVILIVVIMLNDTGAYFGGMLFGKTKAGFEASPNKSWEGYFSGLLFGIIGFILANQVCVSFFSRELFTLIESAILGISLSILANIGDLIESAIKRDGGFKDSGSIIPGHGGMWDVFDATLFALPFFYYYLVLKGIA
ncbi:MAG: phosphatidate cytidylyltransferase [Spirochaetes bacterium]|nr:phosphatidate cytidylyltransferase [Spirochaetota bacterium]